MHATPHVAPQGSVDAAPPATDYHSTITPRPPRNLSPRRLALQSLLGLIVLILGVYTLTRKSASPPPPAPPPVSSPASPATIAPPATFPADLLPPAATTTSSPTITVTTVPSALAPTPAPAH